MLSKQFLPSTRHYFFKRKIGPTILKKGRNYVRSKSQWLCDRVQAIGQGLYFNTKPLILTSHIFSALLEYDWINFPFEKVTLSAGLDHH